MTTIQSVSMAMVLVTVAMLAAAPRRIARAVSKTKRRKGGSSQNPRSSLNMKAKATAQRHTREEGYNGRKGEREEGSNCFQALPPLQVHAI